MVVQRTVVRDEPEQEEDTEQEELQKDWEERLKERKKELRQTSHQILRLQERGAHLAVELEEKKIQIENLQEEIREMASPTLEEEDCDMELSGLKLALTVLTEEETVRHAEERKHKIQIKETAMLRIGCHLSSSKGFLHMGKEAVKIGANTFQFFHEKSERKQGEGDRSGGCAEVSGICARA